MRLPFFLLLPACGATVVPLALSDAAPDTSVRVRADDVDPPDVIVDCGGSGDFDTISAAISAADDGDLIHVLPCTYRESIDFLGKALRIVATEGPEDTVVDARNGAVVRAVNGEGTGTSLEGFTLTGGGDSAEAAVYVDFASLRLEDIVLDGNGGWATIYGASADIELAGVTFTDNRPSYGISIYMSRGGLVATELALDCGSATVGVYLGHGSGMIDRSDISCRGGNATQWEHAVGHVQRSTLLGNVAIVHEDDHYDDFVNLTNTLVDGAVSVTYGSATVRNSIVTGGITFTTVYLSTTVEGSVIEGGYCGITADTTDFTVRNTLFWDNTANACGLLPDPVGTNDNLQEDPLFVDPGAGDWTLGSGSPGVDAGPDASGYADVDGSRNDIGVYGGPFSIGGGW